MTTLNPDEEALAQARQAVHAASRIAVLTGAGVSAESGVPTFRDAQSGLWASFKPEDLATEDAFRSHPERVWNWYAERRSRLQHVQPNAGHVALADFQQRHPGRLTLITQNVDGLHQRAGSTDVLALHGSIADDRWLDPCALARRPQDACSVTVAQPGQPPQCAECGNLLRPDVVWFGEMLPAEALRAAEYAALRCQVMLVVGTSGAVYPAAGLAHTARQAGAQVWVLNPHPSELDEVAHGFLRGPAAEYLPLIFGEDD
ncbi:SIR2 family NAD-dependent protein deacylase [Ottowia sp.]|uniref:SIR2 family NAD-dependent protein deacylase n=1 Tax=Ottowia sp. TaxID=1898956 RepID=UPI003A8AD969